MLHSKIVSLLHNLCLWYGLDGYLKLINTFEDIYKKQKICYFFSLILAHLEYTQKHATFVVDSGMSQS